MFADFIKRLTQPDPAPLPDDDARLALTALLVRIARSDNDYAASESRLIDQIVMQRYGLDADAARALRSDAETLETEAPDTVRFTRAIKDAVAFVRWFWPMAAVLTRKTHCCVWWRACWESRIQTAQWPENASKTRQTDLFRGGM